MLPSSPAEDRDKGWGAQKVLYARIEPGDRANAAASGRTGRGGLFARGECAGRELRDRVPGGRDREELGRGISVRTRDRPGKARRRRHIGHVSVKVMAAGEIRRASRYDDGAPRTRAAPSLGARRGGREGLSRRREVGPCRSFPGEGAGTGARPRGRWTAQRPGFRSPGP